MRKINSTTRVVTLISSTYFFIFIIKRVNLEKYFHFTFNRVTERYQVMKFLSLFVCSVFICLIVAEDDPQVCIQSGCVKGTTFKGNIKEFDGFLGIPYAKPPINELRLKVRLKMLLFIEREIKKDLFYYV